MDALERANGDLEQQKSLLEAGKARLTEDIEVKDAEMAALKGAVAAQVDELVRPACSARTYCSPPLSSSRGPFVHRLINAQPCLQVDLREHKAALSAQVASMSASNADLLEQLQETKGQLSTSTSSLQQADVRNAELAAEGAAMQRELQKERQELQVTQGTLATVQEQLDKARHWNDIQVRASTGGQQLSLPCARRHVADNKGIGAGDSEHGQVARAEG